MCFSVLKISDMGFHVHFCLIGLTSWGGMKEVAPHVTSSRSLVCDFHPGRSAATHHGRSTQRLGRSTDKGGKPRRSRRAFLVKDLGEAAGLTKSVEADLMPFWGHA